MILLAGSSLTSVPTLIKLASSLEVSIDELLRASRSREPPRPNLKPIGTEISVDEVRVLLSLEIGRVRALRGLPPARLASLARVSPHHLSRLEGRSLRPATPRLAVLAALSATLSVKPSQLAGVVLYVPPELVNDRRYTPDGMRLIKGRFFRNGAFQPA
jgi:transcriptional regulator with XRE-family HTH domain